MKNRATGDKEIPFFAVVGSQLKGSLYGETGKNIQALFEFCKQFERCVLFLDEFDELAPSRSGGDASARQTAQLCVPVLLQMMDGFSSGDGTLVIAALHDAMSDAFRMGQSNGDPRSPLEYRYTNEMFVYAVKRAPASTKPSDMQRIQEFKLRGE